MDVKLNDNFFTVFWHYYKESYTDCPGTQIKLAKGDRDHHMFFYFWCIISVNMPEYSNKNDNDNESNFIAMNYIALIIGDVQASSWIRNKLVLMYIGAWHPSQ